MNKKLINILTTIILTVTTITSTLTIQAASNKTTNTINHSKVHSSVQKSKHHKFNGAYYPLQIGKKQVTNVEQFKVKEYFYNHANGIVYIQLISIERKEKFFAFIPTKFKQAQVKELNNKYKNIKYVLFLADKDQTIVNYSILQEVKIK